jgi:hypothetical protein
MLQKLNVPVSVILSYNHKTKKTIPRKLLWENKEYQITRVGLHHHYRQGRTLYHVFSVESPTLFFRLVLNTDDLHWKLEEISDGES